jgi:2'-5' RNA ligase
MRCFAAIELSDGLRRALRETIARGERLAGGLRWASADQLHVTLWFFGETADERVPELCAALAAAARDVPPFDLALATLGCFPSIRSPRVLWCGVDDPRRGCAAWVGAAAPLLARLGYPAESRQFVPHVTLARARGPSEAAAIRRVLAAETSPVRRPVAPSASGTPGMRVEEVVLMESRLDPRGARYLAVHRARLGPSVEPG